MQDEIKKIKCTIMRGGTSKGIFIMEDELPHNTKERDDVICKLFGSPDIRQIDGLGGADVLTSKLAVVGRATRKDADIDYTFGQVSFEKKFIDYKGNCGNISAAVGPYAIDKGLVPVQEPMTTVRIHLTNSDQILTAEVPVEKGHAKVNGSCHIDGVPGTGARIDLDWSDIIGTVCGKILPTNHPKDVFCVDGEEYEVSLVDVGNPVVFIKAGDLGLAGVETPEQIEKNTECMKKIEKIRARAAVCFGLVEKEEEAYDMSPYNPFFAIVSTPRDYECFNGVYVKSENINIVSRLLFMHHMHKAYPITGTVCIGAAMKIPGSIPWELLREDNKDNKVLYIGHPSGILEVYVDADSDGENIRMKSIKVYRTARMIMDGIAYINSN